MGFCINMYLGIVGVYKNNKKVGIVQGLPKANFKLAVALVRTNDKVTIMKNPVPPDLD